MSDVINIKRLLLLLLLGAVLPCHAMAGTNKPELPYYNPHWAQGSPYPVTHTTADFSPLAGPVGPSRRLTANELQWKPLGLVNPWAPMYSSPYPDGRRVIWVGGHDRIAKLDADSLETLATFTMTDGSYLSEDEIKRHIATMDSSTDNAVVEYSLSMWLEAFGSTSSVYRLLTKDNELYIPHRYSDGQIAVRVYGEANRQDPASKIVLKREWEIPASVSRARIMSVNMTPDGWVIMVTQDGVLIALSQDLQQQHVLHLPRKGEEAANQDFFFAFVRNGLSIDEHGGIYAVTRDGMHRIQWTGKKLSLDEADGAWSANYPNELGIGSGTSPGLLGWGDKEDHLVIIADGTKGNNAMVFWRDEIPEDWQGLPNYDRRVAGVTPIRFGVSDSEVVQVENAPVVYGHGAFFNNTFPVKRLPDQGSLHKQWFAESFHMHLRGHEAKGGAMIHWDQAQRKLTTAWQSQTNFVSTVCTVSGATETVYCWGARDQEWTLEGTDWHTGASKFHYVLGKSHRFNPLGGPMIINRNGGIDCGCAGGLGMVRIQIEAER